MEPKEFYSRPMVQRLLDIFDHPSPPAVVTQEKFDHFDDELGGTSKKRWHEIRTEITFTISFMLSFSRISSTTCFPRSLFGGGKANKLMTILADTRGTFTVCLASGTCLPR